jgi:hypothetical protein
MILGSLLLVIPLILALNVWRQYFRVSLSPPADLLQMRVGSAVVLLITAGWLALLGLMWLEDRSQQAKTLAQNINPSAIAAVNLLLCGVGLVCSRFRRARVAGTQALRRSISVSCICLAVIWLFILSNPH